MDGGTVAAIGTAVVSLVVALGAAIKGWGLNRRKDKSQAVAHYEQLFRRQEEQIDRYATTVNHYGVATRKLYALCVTAARASEECHKSHRQVVAVLQEYHAAMTAAGLHPRPLPDFPDLGGSGQGVKDCAAAEYIINSAEMALNLLAEADRRRKRDSDHADVADRTPPPGGQPDRP